MRPGRPRQMFRHHLVLYSPLMSAVVAVSIVSLFLMLSPAIARAVEADWVTFYDSALFDDFKDMAVDEAGNIYLTGTRGIGPTGPETDLVTVKISPDGSILWARILDGPASGQDEARAIALDGVGGVYVVGRSVPSGFNADYVTIRYDTEDGTELWARFYDGPANSVDEANAVVADTSGVFVTGVVEGEGRDFGTIKYGIDGTLLWSAIHNGLGSPPFANDWAVAAALDPAGDVVITGNSAAFNGVDDYATIKYDGATGTQLWLARYAGTGLRDFPVQVVVDGTGDVFVTGQTYQPVEMFATIRYDGATGAEQWAAIDNPGVHDTVNAIALDAEGRVFITGSSDPDGDESNNNDNVYVASYDVLDGSLVWNAYHGTNGNGEWDGGIDLVPDGMGNLYVTGRTNSFGADDDLLLLRYEMTSGAELERSINVNPGSAFDTGWRIDLAPDQDVIIGGMTHNISKDFMVLWFPGTGQVATAIDESATGPARIARLQQNSPNPFNPRTTISYFLPEASQVRLVIYDVSGQLVRTLYRGESEIAGEHSVVWTGRNDRGNAVPSGVYFYRLEAGDFQQSRRMTLIR